MRLPKLLMQPLLWRVVGFTSSVVGLICYALSSSFTHLFGKWNLLKMLIYSVVSFIICSFMLFAKKWKVSRSLLVKAQFGFLVLMLTSLYSFFYDKAVNGKPDLFSFISCAAFSAMSLSLSRQTEFGFEVDLLNFFLGCLTLLLMKINLLLAFIGAAFSYSLFLLRSSLDSQMEIEDARISDHVTLDIDSANQTDYSNQSQQSHRRSPDDEHNMEEEDKKNHQRVSGIIGKPRGLSVRIPERTGSVVPNFKPIPTPSPPRPPSFFSIPPGLSTSDLLESPVLHSASTPQEWSIREKDNWKSTPAQNINEEDNNFSFQPMSIPTFQSSWNLAEPVRWKEGLFY
ncbi:exocyst complex component EXO70B1-like [Senna tora]|uniref:Exocyst complex component EXO70B1-like n=1 Tax=Senna tora TaxID=362788 RepID=A0A834T8P6_9FABA|nr:exocyst complex component EXO70B1-like [Senna tora]